MAFARKQQVGSHVVFVDLKSGGAVVNGVPVVSEEEFFSLAYDQRLFNVAIADSRLRERIVERCLARGAEPMEIRSPDAVIYGDNSIGEGAIFCAFSMVTTNTSIGRFFHSNIYSYVEHDCVIGNYVTFAPRVHCNGNVHIRDHVYVGTAAMIKHGTPGKPIVIGEGAVVGMGAVVTRDVAPYTTVVGNPARPIRTVPRS
jgi:sugar O-acyltransferase (sialic acid O-acetyltransferase NeuD family)